MAVARAYGIPRSTVLGRQVQATTVYHYDAEGRLTHSVTTKEPEWLEEDFDWALADLANEADICPGCGHPRVETTKADAEGKYEAETIRCHACTPQGPLKEKFKDAPPGLLFHSKRAGP